VSVRSSATIRIGGRGSIGRFTLTFRVTRWVLPEGLMNAILTAFSDGARPTKRALFRHQGQSEAP
jgi:hypothetical protein